jgi:hypothetical protein
VRKQTKEQKQEDSVWEIEKSKQRGVAVEIHGYGVHRSIRVT